MLRAGFLLFGLVYGGLALARTPAGAALLLLVYGLYSAAFSGVGRAYVADLAQRNAVATAMGVYQTVNGALVLAASLIAGGLWSRFGAAAPFAFGAVTAVLAAVLLTALCRDPETPAAT